jgi:hypothetical protein
VQEVSDVQAGDGKRERERQRERARATKRAGERERTRESREREITEKREKLLLTCCKSVSISSFTM